MGINTLLIFPPHCLPYQPWLALPSLTGHLRARAVDVVQRDLNVEIYDFLLSPAYLSETRERLKWRLQALESRATLQQGEQRRLLNALRAYGSSASLLAQVEDAKRTLRESQHFYNFSRLQQARRVMATAFQVIAEAYCPGSLSHDAFVIVEAYADAQNLLRWVEDEDALPFLAVFRKRYLPQLLAERPLLIGISISLQEQILPGLALSRMLKERAPASKIVLGGYVLTKLGGRLAAKPDFFRLFTDYVVLGEGEKPLLWMARAVEEGGDPGGAPSILHVSKGRVKLNDPCADLTGDQLPAPDYDGLPLSLYLSPAPILGVAASRGCYWGQCAFCDRGEASGIKYRARPASQVADDLQRLSARHHTAYFNFTDEAIPPKSLVQIADEIVRRNLAVRISADARLEKGLTPEVCRKAARAGFVQLRCGLESACDRVLQLMRKGTRRETIEAALSNLADAGICSHLYVFFGFPGECTAEAEETIEFVLKNKAFISTAAATTFGLLDQSPAFAQPGGFGIAAVDPGRDKLFKYFFDFARESGMSNAEAKKQERRFVAEMRREYEDYSILGELDFGHHLLYCAQYGFKNPALRDGTYKGSSTSGWSRAIERHLAPAVSADVILYESRYDLARIAEELGRGTACEAMPNPMTVLLDTVSGRIVTISRDGAEIMRRVNSRRSILEIAAGLAERYRTPADEIEGAVISFLEDVEASGISIGAGAPARVTLAEHEEE